MQNLNRSRTLKRKLFIIALSIMICSLAGCGTESKADQSAFKATFSLGSIVEANQQLLLPGPRASSGSEGGPTEPFTQTSEVITVQVDPTNVVAFIEAAQSGIQESLASSGAELLGGGGSAGQDPAGDLSEPVHFWISYREGGLEGAVHVWGVPGKESSLVLIVTIVES
jgi:hypothetical protein